MFVRKSKADKLNDNIEKLNFILSRNNIIELSEILGNKKEMLVRNLIAGLSKGIGIGIGFTVLTAIVVIILQKIVTLNIPVIGEYIADIVDIVQSNIK